MKTSLLKKIREIVTIEYFPTKIVLRNKRNLFLIHVRSQGNETKEFLAMCIMLKELEGFGLNKRRFRKVYKSFIERDLIRKGELKKMKRFL